MVQIAVVHPPRAAFRGINPLGPVCHRLPGRQACKGLATACHDAFGRRRFVERFLVVESLREHGAEALVTLAHRLAPSWICAGIRPSKMQERSEEHTSELQSLMRHSYAVFCLKKKKQTQQQNENLIIHKTQTDPRLKTEILYNIMNHITDNQMKNMYYIKLECANTQYI